MYNYQKRCTFGPYKQACYTKQQLFHIVITLNLRPTKKISTLNKDELVNRKNLKTQFCNLCAK